MAVESVTIELASDYPVAPLIVCNTLAGALPTVELEVTRRTVDDHRILVFDPDDPYCTDTRELIRETLDRLYEDSLSTP